MASSSLAKEPAVDSDALDKKPLFPSTADDRKTNTASSKSMRNQHRPAPPGWIDNWDVNKIRAIAEAQVRSSTNDWPKQMRKSIDPARVLPKENAWGRPFTPKVVKRKEQKHFARILADLMPPLPRGEWDLLESLSLGRAETKIFEIPSRRTMATPPVASQESTKDTNPEWDWAAYATKPVRAVERSNSRTIKSLSGASDEDPRSQGRPIGVKHFGRRRLRRSIYSRVWETSPILETSAKEKIQVTFGKAHRELSPAAATDLQFFMGVDDEGAPASDTKLHKRDG